MTLDPPGINDESPTQVAAWRQWVTDSIVWMQRELAHLHDCIETRIGEAKTLIHESGTQQMELAESRYQQNIKTLNHIDTTTQLLQSFRENATQKEIEEAATNAERRRVADAKAKQREQVKGLLWKGIEYAGAATVLGLAITGVYAIASLFGLGG